MAQEVRSLSKEAVVRPPAGEVYTFGPIRVDVGRHVVTRDGQPIALTPKAFELLLILVRSGGRVLSRQELVAARAVRREHADRGNGHRSADHLIAVDRTC